MVVFEKLGSFYILMKLYVVLNSIKKKEKRKKKLKIIFFYLKI